MPESRSTSANFHNSDKVMSSPDNFYKLVYYNLNEIGMGGPLGGECYLEGKDKQKIKIHNWCGGPPAWERAGRLVAVPIWIRHSDKGLLQHIGVVDVVEKELRIYSKTFSVVELRGFEGKVIFWEVRGRDKNSRLAFEIGKEEIYERVMLVE